MTSNREPETKTQPPQEPGQEEKYIPFNPALFQRLLRTTSIGRTFTSRPVTTSTMDVAAHEANENCPAGTLVFAEFQTEGRGNGPNRHWDSGHGKNLLFTIVLRLDDAVKLLLPMVTPIAMAECCRAVGANAWTKWPNDVWIGMKKAGGMLIDAAKIPQVQLVGVGINVNQDMSDQHDRTSISTALCHPVTREFVLATFCNWLEKLLTQSPAALLDKYKSRSHLLGCQVDVYPKKLEAGKLYSATVVGFTDYGIMQVRKDDGSLVSLSAEEITIRPGASIPAVEPERLWRPADIAAYLTGTWQNELGSTMTLTADNYNSIQGVYHTAVGSTHYDHPLQGRWAPAITDGGAVLAFSVAWDKLDPGFSLRSATSWSGRLFIDSEKQTGSIHTLWSLVSEVPLADEWKAFTVNKDLFVKTQ